MTTIVELARDEVPPNVASVARSLRNAPGLVVLASAGAGRSWNGSFAHARTSFVACDPIATLSELVPYGAEARTDRGYGGAPAAPRFIGVLPYEAFRACERAAWAPKETRPPRSLSVPIWHRYDACVRIDHDAGRVAIEADSASAAAQLRDRLRATLDSAHAASVPRPFEWRSIDRADASAGARAHRDRVARILALIRAGDVYQVNVARELCFRVGGDRLETFLCMMQRSPVPFGFYGLFGMSTVLGASPELALEVSGPNLVTSPIKGTRPRGADARSDDAEAHALEADEKERAELTMAIDLHRNDLGKVAITGSVRVPLAPAIKRGAHVMSRAANLIALRRPDASLGDCIRAMLPCGSVTGAPKIRAMEIIAALEPVRRGLYTGAYGLIGRDGRLVLAMAIRTAIIDETRPNEATYLAGGGIVSGSVPAREEEETRWKAAHLVGLARTSAS